MNIPELTEDAVIELAREGGVAFIPQLSGLRRIALSALTPQQRERVIDILQQALQRGFPPGQTDSPGRGDQRYFRIQISYSTQQSAGAIVILIPEQLAPPELESLWRDG